LEFATFLVWQLRIAACGVGAIGCGVGKKFPRKFVRSTVKSKVRFEMAYITD